jgi:hypothetical protein
MRISSIAAAAFFLTACNFPSTGSASDLWEDCVNVQETDAAITLCTKVVEDAAQDAGDRARAYAIRAREYKLRNDLDRAGRLWPGDTAAEE